jgi:hypothetical protein
MIAISRTLPFRKLQGRIGSATYRLNTVLVGLALVADGCDKPRELAVTWTKPPTKTIAKQVADQAEIFSCTAAVVFAADVFDQFIREIAKQEWLDFSPNARDIATKAKTRAKNEGGDYSVAERVVALLSDLKVPIGPGVAAIELFSKWRNITVHSSEREYKLDTVMRKLLIKGKEHFNKHYSHLNIELAIQNFESRKTPVPKEATSLIAVAQNISRSIDEASIRRAAGTPQLVQKVADKLLMTYFTNSKRKTQAWIEIAEAWQGPMERRRTNLEKIMQKVGLTDTQKAVSAELPASYIEEIVALDREDVADRFGIKKTAGGPLLFLPGQGNI